MGRSKNGRKRNCPPNWRPTKPVEDQAALSLFKLASEIPDTIVYHYTSCAGLQGIITDNLLRACCFAYLNDPTELEFGRNAFLNLAKHLIDEIGDVPNGSTIPDLMKALTESVAACSLFDTYGCSFSSGEGRDTKSQWNLYGDKFEGYAIGFRLKDLLTQINASGCYVEYTPDAHADNASHIMRQVLETMQQHAINGKRDQTIEYYREMFDTVVSQCLPMFKNPDYDDEHEFRIIANPEWAGGPRNIKTYQRGSELIPYIELRAKEQLPIEEVIMGPCHHDFDKTEYGLRLFLDAHGHKSASIARSQLRITKN